MRSAGLSPSQFSKIMTAYGLTDAQQRKYDELTTRTKPLTDNMKQDLESLNEKLRNPFSQTAISYAEEVVMRMMGVELDEITTYAMQWGIDNEPFAIELYERTRFVSVEQKRRITHPEYDFITGEPDGEVGSDLIIEVKCLNSANHMKNLLYGEQIKDYMEQMQGYMWLTGARACDFISYDPRFPERYQLSVHRVNRDDAMIKILEERCVKFWHQIVLPLKDRLENK